MGKALVLHNVDFTENALDQVTLIKSVHCSGITLDEDTLEFDKVGDTIQLTATLTPSNTTDTLSWISSNTNVATVDNVGNVTINGIGSATITAKCGEQTASASITQTTIKPAYGTMKAQGYSVGKDGDVIKTKADASWNLLAESYVADNEDLHLKYGNAIGGVELIRVPYGATKACIATTNDTPITVSYTFLADTTDLYIDGNNKYAKYISSTTWVNTETGITVEYGQGIVFMVNEQQFATLDYVYFE